MPPLSKTILTGVILALFGWMGLTLLVHFTLPTLGPRWLFFFLLMLALSGSALPVVAFLNRRFPGPVPATGAVVVRQAVWVGIYGNVIAWLQLGRVLNPALAFFLAAGFVLIELLLRLREKSLWKPRDATDE